MSRRTERVFLGALSFVGAVLALVVGVQLLTGTGSVDVTASSGGVEATTAPAAPSGDDADSGVGAAPDSLVVSTTAGSAATTPTSTTLDAAETSTTAADDDATSTSTSAAVDGDDSTTTRSSETTVPSDAEGSVTTATTGGTTSSETQVSVPTTVGQELTDIEREIIRLTNELRANPAGPHRRQKPMPACVNDDERLEIDPETGHPKPVRRLTPSQPVSIQMSRDWSQQMAAADAMSHRSAESQSAIYAELGIDWAARGENVAWAVGYDLSNVAQLFFKGWRESDGHYCNMMSGAFSEIGVGHVRTGSGKDFATQNFYRPR